MAPSGAALDPGQQAVLAAFATALGGGAAALAGVNVQGAMTAAQNEALNNAGQHPGQGGLLSTIGTWLQNTYGDPVGSFENWGNQFLGMVTSSNGQTPPSDPNNQLSGGSNGNPPNTGAAPVTPPTVACAPGAGCVVTPPLVSSGSPNNAPSNAIFSSGNSGNDSGSGSTGQGPSNSAGGSWVSVNESMSSQAQAYQTQITGVTGEAYVVNGVKFDGVSADGTLLDAKGPGYANFVGSNGEFQSWFTGQTSLIDQAERQVAAAQGQPIQWSVAEPSAATAIKNLLSDEGIKGIIVIYQPPK